MSQVFEIKEELPSNILHTGREDFVFSPQQGIDGLFNIHKALIKKVWDSRQEIKYLLYSPIYNAKSSNFRAKTIPSSCTLLTAEDKFIITKNYHSPRIFPHIYVIDFKDILNLELGSSGLLGWLRVEFLLSETRKEVSIFFGKTSGMRHFSNCLSIYFKQSDIYFRNRKNCVYDYDKENLPFLPEPWRIFLKIKKEPIWIKKRFLFVTKEKPLSLKQTIFAEGRGLIIVEEKDNSLLGARNFLFMPYGKITGSNLENLLIHKVKLIKLSIILSRNHYHYSILFNPQLHLNESRHLSDLLQEVSTVNSK